MSGTCKVWAALPESGGIYVIRNNVNGKVYIGSSSKMRKRVRKHVRMLRQGKHSAHFQSSWNLYGELAFEASVLESVELESDLIPAEQRWLDKTECYNREKGYNTSTKAERCVHTQESKEKLRIKSTGKRYSDEVNQKKALHGEDNGFFGRTHSLETKIKMAESKGQKVKPFICIETGQIFHFHIEAADALKARGPSISDCLKGTKYVSNGFHFIYLDRIPFQFEQHETVVVLNDKQRAVLVSMVDKRRRLFECVQTGQTFTSVKEAGRSLQIDRTSITHCLRGTYKQTGGKTFRYVALG